MAGNIIPAIATTNAITAGMVLMRAFNVLQEQYDLCQSVYVRLRANPRNQIFVPDRSKLKYSPYTGFIVLNLNCFVFSFLFKQLCHQIQIALCAHQNRKLLSKSIQIV